MARRDVAVVGVYTTEQGRGLGRSTLDLTREALVGGIDDAGLSWSDIDGFMGGSFPPLQPHDLVQPQRSGGQPTCAR